MDNNKIFITMFVIAALVVGYFIFFGGSDVVEDPRLNDDRYSEEQANQKDDWDPNEWCEENPKYCKG